jgi:hypothetical protein
LKGYGLDFSSSVIGTSFYIWMNRQCQDKPNTTYSGDDFLT